jgi:hypothetical protein
VEQRLLTSASCRPLAPSATDLHVLSFVNKGLVCSPSEPNADDVQTGVASSGNTSMDPWARPFARLREDERTHGSGPGLGCKPEASGKDEASSPQEPTVASSPGAPAFALAGSGTCCPRVSEASAPTKASPAPANIALR